MSHNPGRRGSVRLKGFCAVGQNTDRGMLARVVTVNSVSVSTVGQGIEQGGAVQSVHRDFAWVL